MLLNDIDPKNQQKRLGLLLAGSVVKVVDKTNKDDIVAIILIMLIIVLITVSIFKHIY